MLRCRYCLAKGEKWARPSLCLKVSENYNIWWYNIELYLIYIFYVMYVVVIWLQQNDLGNSRPIIQPFVSHSVCSSKCFSNWCDDSSFSNSDFYIWTFFKVTTLKGDVPQSAEPRRVTVLMGSFTHPVAWLKKTHSLGRGQSLKVFKIKTAPSSGSGIYRTTVLWHTRNIYVTRWVATRWHPWAKQDPVAPRRHAQVTD